MKQFIVLTLLLAACRSSGGPQKTGPQKPGNGFAVLELFTSEGCSSCPPAEALLEDIQKESAGKPVFILSFHVDYWDHLGWKDPFSSHAFSQRQYDYSTRFNGQVYTPQLVVNGVAQGVGSDEAFVRGSLSKMLASHAAVSLMLRLSNGVVAYEAAGAGAHARLELAVVQKQATSVVTRGENEGRTLPQVQIVRALTSFDLGDKTTGSANIELPAGFNTKDWEIIGLLKNTDIGEIIAANRATIP
jgi:hypothetical protein